MHCKLSSSETCFVPELVHSLNDLDPSMMDIPLLPDIEPAQQLELENESFRLIHFHTMINFITTFCFCQCNGRWRYDKEDTKYSLSTRLHFSCSRCLDRQAWDTSPQIKLRDQSHTVILTKERAHKEPKNQPLINVRATLASITLGGGASLLDRFFGFLHVPHLMTHRTFDKISRKIGSIIGIIAEESKEKSRHTEVSLSEEAGAAVNFVLSKKNIPLVHITGSYDACWSKRSHMHHGSASAGTGVIIGQKSHKVILHGEKVAKGVWKKVKDHYCSRNWHQSAKAMEADIAVQCFLEAPDHGMIISTLIGDEDSSVQKRLRDLEDVIGPIKKLSDFTHIKRNFGSQLYGLHASFKGIKMD
ncbi:hypothetical protein PROFUN_09295 [Planoprotostelium fungivorum]|uniref:Mutator-like transposase domain-containing protein n=1 Tax=Planoprotostelium fungivorum TaxID=1890364 RepID=A0A2P6NH96_9EUKA|nr:hypothetical protein PROFUN_09295 [Planoprotostelium fungivorum]